jgi:hypothetical protein
MLIEGVGIRKQQVASMDILLHGLQRGDRLLRRLG